MDTQTNGAPNSAADQGEQVTIGKVELAALQANAAKVASLEASYKSVQRELERARKSGDSTSTLRQELEALEALLIPTAEAVHKIAKGAELETNVETALTAHKVKKEKKSDTSNEDAQAKAGSDIVLAAEAAGITDFETVWRADERFGVARAFWEAGNYDRAVAEFVRGAAKPKPLTESDVKARVDEAVAKSVRSAAGAAQGGASTATNKGAVTMADFQKLPPDERLKIWNDPDKKAALLKRG